MTAASGYRVDIGRGRSDGTVSTQWMNRPEDQRYLSLSELHAAVHARAATARSRIIETRDIGLEPGEGPDGLALSLEGTAVDFTHWSFGQLASLAGAPASWLRRLPARLAALNLQYGLAARESERVQAYVTSGDDGTGGGELRAMTGPGYGRILDHELVGAVMRFAGDGTGDTPWKVPGVLDWTRMIHNPHVDVTKETTTLYASDRDVFLFLVDDTRPIEAGRLPDGSPDLYFRGFYCWNSEVGAARLGLATFYLRAVCQNRTLWGVEDFRELKVRHTRLAPDRFARDVEPALTRFTQGSPVGFVQGMAAARARILARNNEERTDLLRTLGIPGARVSAMLAQAEAEEGRPPESAYDFVQVITSSARAEPHQDRRVALERLAGGLLARVQ